MLVLLWSFVFLIVTTSALPYHDNDGRDNMAGLQLVPRDDLCKYGVEGYDAMLADIQNNFPNIWKSLDPDIQNGDYAQSISASLEKIAKFYRIGTEVCRANSAPIYVSKYLSAMNVSTTTLRYLLSVTGTRLNEEFI